jgi:hypothetical protein
MQACGLLGVQNLLKNGSGRDVSATRPRPRAARELGGSGPRELLDTERMLCEQVLLSHEQVAAVRAQAARPRASIKTSEPVSCAACNSQCTVTLNAPSPKHQ